ncbi:hypothetical protein BCR44DRAFT_1425990 [Catenaria anguillulae PL171]|uniref:Uncharacterized protein n=1 Tax=Catenaria anguillulae PL171 TaxID=765915 RepID=A0A1Y2I3I5_9FUNG|nr:hypothetical protein BCR44DRAFT_1425990 [Catenaria anguillulae PL171]
MGKEPSVVCPSQDIAVGLAALEHSFSVHDMLALWPYWSPISLSVRLSCNTLIMIEACAVYTIAKHNAVRARAYTSLQPI